MIDIIRNNFSWIKDIVVVVGIVGMMYLQGHYVTREKFEAYSAANESAHNTLISTLASMDKTLAIMGRNQSDISRLETQVSINTRTLDLAVQQNKIDAEYNDLFKSSANKISELTGRINNIEALNLSKFIQDSLISSTEKEHRLKALESIHPHQAISTKD